MGVVATSEAMMINRRWLLNVVLALFVVALVLVVKFQPGRPEPAAEATLTTLQSETVKDVRLARPGEAEIRFERSDQGWRLVSPVRARADRFRVENLLQLATAKVKARFPAGGDLAQYGLATPIARVRIDGTEIGVGGQHALNDLRYVLVNNEVLLVPGASARAVTNSLSDFFSARLIEDGRKPVAFSFPTFRLQAEGGTWKVQPENKELSTDVVNAFVDQWRYARALSVARYSGKPVRGRVRVTYLTESPDKGQASGTPLTLDLAIVARKPELVIYRADEGLEYHFPQETGDRLMTLAPQ
jgi:hypothetical protein